jgi:hypothetical protein
LRGNGQLMQKNEELQRANEIKDAIYPGGKAEAVRFSE